MKKYYKKILLLFLICIPLFFSLFSNVSAQSTTQQLDFKFNNEILINTDLPINHTLNYNLRNPINYSNNYNATYTFTDDTVGSNPIGWSVDETGGTVDIINTIDGHDKIIQLNDTSSVNAINTQQSFSSQTNGTIEYFLRSTDSSRGSRLDVRFGSTAIIYINLLNNKINYYDSSWIPLVDAVSDTWYHIRIDIECSANGYFGLSQYYYRVHINGITYNTSTGIPLISNENSFTNIRYVSDSTNPSPYSIYVDAVDYSWDFNYSINRNTIPLFSTNASNFEIDKFQFNYNDDLIKFPDGTDNPNGWTDIEGNKDSVNTKTINGYTFVEIIDVVGMVGNDNGLERTFSSNAMRLDTSVSFSVNQFAGFTDYFIFDIYSSDNTLITRIGFYVNPILGGIILYWDGSTWQDIYPLIIELLPNNIHTFDLNIDYYNELCSFNLYVNNTLNQSRLIPLITTSKSGLSDVKAYAQFQNGVDSTQNFYIHDIGIYVNGSSLSDDSYGVIYDLNTPMNSDFHNLFSVGTEGNITDGALSLIDINFTESYNLISKGNYSDRTFFKNYYFDNFNINNIGIVYLLTANSSYSDINLVIDNLYIRGVSLSESSNKYWIDFTYGNVNIDDNYFYVDSLNRLQYNLSTNDNNTEYIQATFDINDISSTNRFLSFRSRLFGLATGTFRVQFLTTSNIVVLDRLDRTYNEIITQGLTIDKFVLLITDDNTLYTTDTIGFYTNIRLRYTQLESTIITLMMVSMIIPLIIILTPTIAISNVYSKSLIVPLFLFMSIISVVSLLIPTWLFFIIGFCSILFLYTEKEKIFEELE